MSNQQIQEEIENITSQLVTKYKPQKVILFGSAAIDGGPEPNDLDFLIIKDDVPKDSLERMREVRRLVEKNFAADFLIYKPSEWEERIKLGDPFIQTIIEEGRVLYA